MPNEINHIFSTLNEATALCAPKSPLHVDGMCPQLRRCLNPDLILAEGSAHLSPKDKHIFSLVTASAEAVLPQSEGAAGFLQLCAWPAGTSTWGSPGQHHLMHRGDPERTQVLES